MPAESALLLLLAGVLRLLMLLCGVLYWSAPIAAKGIVYAGITSLHATFLGWYFHTPKPLCLL